MMTSTEFRTYLERLGLSQTEAATLLSVNSRTVRRWIEASAELPASVEHALRAWMRLHLAGLAWRPDSVEIGEVEPEKIAEQIARYRAHAIELDELLQKVKARGGPIVPWEVNLKKCQATLGPMRVSFYPLVNGSFSPQSYTRRDDRPDLKRDWALIEDALACIANAISKAEPNWADKE